jgi:hypothetical protein
MAKKDEKDPLAGIPPMDEWGAFNAPVTRAMGGGPGRAQATKLAYERDAAEQKLVEWLVAQGMQAHTAFIPTVDGRMVRITMEVVAGG